MRDVYYKAVAYYEATALREALGEKFAELENERGVQRKGENIFVSYQRGEGEDILTLPEIVRQVRPRYYTTHIQVVKPWIGMVVVLGSNKKLSPAYQNNKGGTMGFFVRGGVTVYATTTHGYTEIEYVSLYPAGEGQLKIRRNRLFSANLALQATAPEELIRSGVAEAIKDVPHSFSGYILDAFQLAKARIRAYREANPRSEPEETAMGAALQKAGLIIPLTKEVRTRVSKKKDQRRHEGEGPGPTANKRQKIQDLQEKEAAEEIKDALTLVNLQ